MYPFSYILEYDKDAECFNLCLIEADDDTHNHQYNLLIPETLKDKRDLRIFVAITMLNWMNGEGKKATFKQVTRKFEQFCATATRLKI